MSKYECGICGNTYNEEAAGTPFSALEDGWECPVCGSPKQMFSCPDSGEPAQQAPAATAGGKVYECGICGNTYSEESAGTPFTGLEDGWECSVCGAPKTMFTCPALDSAPAQPAAPTAAQPEGGALAYPEDCFRTGDSTEQQMDAIHEMAVTGRSIIEPMRTRLPLPSWDDIYFLGAQLDPFPLDESDFVETKTVIGQGAKQPMEIGMPVYISHMSFGALSREAKTALAKGAALAGTAICSGEGGILPDEFEAAHRYVFEYVPNQYSVTDENLQRADAIEIKIGQGTKPGMGGHLPGTKVTEEIAAVRGKSVGEDIISPSKFPGINHKDDLKALVADLRARSGGRPVGIKLAAGHIERDMAVATYAQPDFITIDGRGGATGASPKFLKDASSVPTIFALHRARKYLDDNKIDNIDLIITGGLRTSGDIIKALCMGADAVALASAALMAAACQQFRVCHMDRCPSGMLTQDPALRKNLNVDVSAQRVANFLNVVHSELQTFGRVSGHNDLKQLGVQDICTANSEISNYTDIPHV